MAAGRRGFSLSRHFPPACARTRTRTDIARRYACPISDSYYGCSKGSAKFNFNGVTPREPAREPSTIPLSDRGNFPTFRPREPRRDILPRMKPAGSPRSSPSARRWPTSHRGNSTSWRVDSSRVGFVSFFFSFFSPDKKGFRSWVSNLLDHLSGLVGQQKFVDSTYFCNLHYL